MRLPLRKGISKNKWAFVGIGAAVLALSVTIHDVSTIHVYGKATRSADLDGLVFVCEHHHDKDVALENGSFEVRLPQPGPYQICYRVLNNFKRFASPEEITEDGRVDIRFDALTMTISMTNISPVFHSERFMIYMCDEQGNHSGIGTDNIQDITLDLTYEVGLFMETCGALAIVPERARKGIRIPCRFAAGKHAALDFATGTQIDWPPKRKD